MKRSILYFIYLCILISTPACKSSQIPQEGELLFSLQKTQCYGTCPAYELKIYPNGYAELEGKAYFRYQGVYQGQVSQDKIDYLITFFQEKNFMKLKDRYTAEITDLPTTYVYFSHKGQSKKVMDYYNAPKALIEMEKELEKVIDVVKWKEKK